MASSKQAAFQTSEIRESFFDDEINQSNSISLQQISLPSMEELPEEDGQITTPPEEEVETYRINQHQHSRTATSESAHMVHTEVLQNKTRRESIRQRKSLHLKQRGGQCCCQDAASNSATNALGCRSCFKKSPNIDAAAKEIALERKFEDGTVTPLFWIPFLITLQNIWDVIKHCSGIYNNLQPLPHVAIALFVVVLIHLLSLSYLHLLQTGRSSRFQNLLESFICNTYYLLYILTFRSFLFFFKLSSLDLLPTCKPIRFLTRPTVSFDSI